MYDTCIVGKVTKYFAIQVKGCVILRISGMVCYKFKIVVDVELVLLATGLTLQQNVGQEMMMLIDSSLISVAKSEMEKPESID